MVLLTGALTLFGPLCVDLYLPALPRLTSDLHASASTGQLSLTATLIGLGLGQLLIGPISDRLGRRPPLLLGLTVFVIASAACAAAPDIPTFIALRFVQGLGGAAGIVIALAVVRDQFSGSTAVRFLSALLVVTGMGPIVAPQIGAALLTVGSWRVLFLALAAAGAVLIGVASVWLAETLPTGRRHAGGMSLTLSTLRAVASDRRFVVPSAANALCTASVFAYIAGASFALQNIYGLGPQQFSLVFALSALGLVVSSRINSILVARVGAARLLTAGLIGMSAATGALLISVLESVAYLPFVMACTFVAMTSFGMVSPNSAGLALADFSHAAGSASSLLGLQRFVAGSIAAPLAGVGGTHDMVPMAVIMSLGALSALILRVAVPTQGPMKASPEEVLPVSAGESRSPLF